MKEITKSPAPVSKRETPAASAASPAKPIEKLEKEITVVNEEPEKPLTLRERLGMKPVEADSRKPDQT